ncbi:hypothetical protein C479_11977 [Halovivax asiaticus JCM 14624]|uniref:Uncharacterized protein n=1 Tax=Halovivax asiaticus JCM 14624 TaxID=1227490 RepID=M0BFP0_9EURY|nr:hypothetical protein [Halovivax asiaticus]ELZ09103.1 hypothetical protein C479_11977 [Halovivax asiaticus JCM 14624]
MTESKNEGLVGANAVAVESLVLALLSPIVWGTSTFWEYDLVFLIAAAFVIILMVIRVMAGKAENPDIGFIRQSLGWSSRLLDLLLIGSLAAISIRISSLVEFFSPVAVFAGLAIVSTIGFVLLEQKVLGGYAETWKGVIDTETENNPIGRLLREAGDFGESQLSAIGSDESPDPPEKGARGAVLAVLLLLLLLVVSAPIWLVLSIFFDNWKAAVLILFSLFFLRDTTRYMYLGYGAASNFSDLRWPLKWEFIWSAVKGIIIAFTLGYELSPIL